MKPTTISVIIPTLNEEASIGLLLSGLAKHDGLEIVVSDGGSSDKTIEVLKDWRVKFISGPAGRGRQMNLGAENSTGDILFFLHADSYWEPVIFDQVRQAVQSGRTWGCCTLAFNESTPFFKLVAAASNLRVRLTSSCYGDQGIFCEREMFFRAGGFPETPFMEDLILSSILRRTIRAVQIKGVIVTSTRRFRKNGMWKTLIKMQAVKLMHMVGMPPSRLIKYYQSSGKQA